MNQDILNYLKEQTKNGYSYDQLKQALLKVGYTLQEINEAYAALNTPAQTAQIKPSLANNNTATSSPQKQRYKYLIISSIILLVLIFGVVSIYLFLYAPPVQFQAANIEPSSNIQEQTSPEPEKINGVLHCYDHEDCFYKQLKDCTISTFTGSLGVLPYTTISIQEGTEGNCALHYEFVTNPQPELQNTNMDCQMPRNDYTAESYQEYYSTNVLTVCSGTYIDALTKLTS